MLITRTNINTTIIVIVIREYVEDVFRYSPPELLDLAQNELRKLIMEKHTEGTLMTTDWSEMDLPRYLKIVTLLLILEL